MAELLNKKTPRDILRVVFRRRLLFLLGAALFGVGVLVAAQWLPLKYTAVAKFERWTDPLSEAREGAGSQAFEAEKLKLEHELTGREAATAAAQELGLFSGLPREENGRLTKAGRVAREAILRDFRERIAIGWEVRSRNLDLVSVSFTHSDPNLARGAANFLAERYTEKFRTDLRTRLAQRKQDLETRLSDARIQLRELQRRLNAFEMEHAGMMPPDPGLLRDRIRNVRMDIEELQRRGEAARRTLAQLEAAAEAATSQPASQPFRMQMPNPDLARLKEELRTYEEALETETRFARKKPKHPDIIVLREKIEALKKEIEQTPERIPAEGELYGGRGAAAARLTMEMNAASARSELETVQKRVRRLEKELDDLQGLWANLGPVRQRYEEMQGALSLGKAKVERLEDQLADANTAQVVESGALRTRIDLVEYAPEQYLPSSPSLVMVLAGAVIGGLAFGGGLVFLAHVLDRSVMTPEDAIGQFNVPVHGVISEIVSRGQRTVRWVRRAVVGPAVAVVVVLALCTAGLNIVLRLRYPNQYAEWRASPIGYVSRSVKDLTGGADEPY
jgi:uncharacterized protein involved in exopolysaccharide biosynthesis